MGWVRMQECKQAKGVVGGLHVKVRLMSCQYNMKSEMSRGVS